METSSNILKENIAWRMRYQTPKKYVEEFKVFTGRELELSGIKNGVLMTYCVKMNLTFCWPLIKTYCTNKILTNIELQLLFLIASQVKLKNW